MAPNPQATIALHTTGQKIPLVGFGLWKVTKSETATTIYNAIKAGYRLFDGACDYGNEKEAVEGICKAIKDPLIKREDLFVTTKLSNTFHEREHVRPAAERQNEEFGFGYVNLYLVHMPILAKYVDPAERYPPGWSIDGKSATHQAGQSMARAQKSLLTKRLTEGASRIADHRPSPLRPHASLSLPNRTPPLLQQSLFNIYNDEKIATTAYSSLKTSSFIELSIDKSISPLIEDPKIVTIAKRHSKAPAQIFLRWATQRGVAVIQKSNNHDRILQNLDCYSFDLSEQVKTISAYDRGLRFVNPAEICDPPICIFA